LRHVDFDVTHLAMHQLGSEMAIAIYTSIYTLGQKLYESHIHN